MRLINTNTGAELQPGQWFTDVHGRAMISKVEERLLSARALVLRPSYEGVQRQWVPLVVRYTHPAFFGRKVAFLPS